MIKQFLDISAQQAKEKELASPKVLELYTRLRDLSRDARKAMEMLSDSHAGRAGIAKKTDAECEAEMQHYFTAQTAALNQKEKYEFSELLALDQAILNGATSLERTMKAQPLHEYFESFIAEAIAKGKIDDLIEIREKFLFSIVQTMHPVVWHTPEAKDFEWGFKSMAADVSEFLKGMLDGVIPGHEQGKFAGHIGNFIDMLKTRDDEGKVANSITPLRFVQKNTIGAENRQEDDDKQKLTEALVHTVKEWNVAVNNIRGTFQSDKLLVDKLANLHFSPDLDQVQFRTWGRSADADGRDAATSIELYRTIAAHTKNNKYTGPLLDLRQNAKMHLNLVSGLIQNKYLTDKKFANTCEIFASGKYVKGTKTEDSPGIPYVSKGNILQQLSDDDQRDFLLELLQQDSPEAQLVPDEMKKQPKAFNRQFQSYCEKLGEILGIDPNTSLNELSHIEIEEKHHAAIRDFLGLNGKADLKYYTNAYKVLSQKVKQSEFDGISENKSKFELSGVNYRAQNYHDAGSFFEDQKMMKGDEIIPMDNKTRFVTLDIIKRLSVAKDALDSGLKVADRHQIANFSCEADFFNLMLLFKEGGLIKIKDGLVTEAPPIAIQPLLETGEDMRNANKIFSELLKNPLAESYYKKMGKAHFMVGFSDGAKSAGNFASEWQVRQCKKDLYKLFRDKFGPEFQIDILDGTGRGANRGGVIEGGVATHIYPPEVQATAVLDRTLQADEPWDLASSPAYAHEYLGSTIVGTMNGALRSKETLNKFKSEAPEDKAFVERYKTYEKICAFIAAKSEDKFVSTIIKKNVEKDGKTVTDKTPAADTLAFLSYVPDNSLRSSREPKRDTSGDPVKDYDATRAITIEKGFEKAGLPTTEVGLKSALDAVVAEYEQHPEWHMTQKYVEGAEGNVVERKMSAQQVLQSMYNEFDFFHTQVNKRNVNLNTYKPDVADQYAKASNKTAYIDDIKGELNGLKEKLQGIAGNKPMQIGSHTSNDAELTVRNTATRENAASIIAAEGPKKHDICEAMKFEAAESSIGLGKLASALILSHAYKDGEVKPVERIVLNPTVPERTANRDRADTLHNAEYTVAQSLVAAQKMPERMRLKGQVTSIAA